MKYCIFVTHPGSSERPRQAGGDGDRTDQDRETALPVRVCVGVCVCGVFAVYGASR